MRRSTPSTCSQPRRRWRLCLSGLVLAASFASGCDGGKSSDPAAGKPAAESAGGDTNADAKKETLGAFNKFQRHSMSSEALVQLAALRDGVRAYAAEERVAPGTVTVTTGTLPPSAPLTPAAGTCCKQPKGLCPVGSVDWSHEGFNALNFAPDQPHRYSYEVVVDGKTVTVRAVGDLDCDGTYSNFESVGTLADGEVTFDGKPTQRDPLE